jgi:hypothetical protein
MLKCHFPRSFYDLWPGVELLVKNVDPVPDEGQADGLQLLNLGLARLRLLNG